MSGCHAPELPKLVEYALDPVAVLVGTEVASDGVFAVVPPKAAFIVAKTLRRSMELTELPDVLQSAVDAINGADVDAFVNAFAMDGVIDDWGRILKGHSGARSWAGSDAIGAGAQMTIVSAETTGDTTHIVFDWTSRVFNGRSHAFVTIHDGLIARFRIPSN